MRNSSQSDFRYDILIISDDVVGPRMAGPGIRCWEMAKTLARHFRVALAIPDYSYSPDKNTFFQALPFSLFRYSLGQPRLIKELTAASRILIAQGYILSKFPFLPALPIHFVVDIYVPFVLENLFTHRSTTPNLKDRQAIHLHDLRVFNDQLRRGDHFLCATARQRDLLLGCLLSLNRLTPEVVDQSPELDDLVSVVPFGIEEEDAPSTRLSRPLRLLFPQIGEKDIILLWGGVLTNWFDPITLLYAFQEAVQEKPRLKLVFLSTCHPNPLLPKFAMAQKAINVARELGLLNRFVFFNETWVDYPDRAAYFAEADIGVSIHQKHLETEFSFRTRILDYLKHELPIICTEGDYFAELVAEEELGMVVPAGGRAELKGAILRLAEDEALRGRIKEKMRPVRERYTWSRVLEPLRAHCEQVLAGKVKSWPMPLKRELKYVCLPYKQSWIKGLLKRIMGKSWVKVSWKLRAWRRRILG